TEVVGAVSGAVQLARIPRAVGTSTGVNEMLGSIAPAARRFCNISGVWRWAPPTPYGVADPISSAPIRCGLRALPAPDGTTAAVTTTSRPSTSPAATAGNSARVTAVTLQPGTAMRVAPASNSRCRGSSGSTYGQVPAWSVP